MSYATGEIINGVIVVNNAIEPLGDNPLLYVFSEYPTYSKIVNGRLQYNYEFYTDKKGNKYLIVDDFKNAKDDIPQLLAKADWNMARNVDAFVDGADKNDYKRWLDLIS